MPCRPFEKHNVLKWCVMVNLLLSFITSTAPKARSDAYPDRQCNRPTFFRNNVSWNTLTINTLICDSLYR